jgi:Flp pilus assembly protein TadG
MTWFQDPARQPRRPLKTPAQQRGAAVVEFALILPILLGLLVAGIDASLAFYDKAVITNASREGARAGIVARNPMLTDAQIQSVVTQYAQSVVSFGANPAQPTVLIQWLSLNGDPALKVTVSYTFEGIGLGSLFQSLGKPWVLQASTVMVYE